MLCDFKCHLKFKVSFVKYIYSKVAMVLSTRGM